jgi:hypothetical protein
LPWADFPFEVTGDFDGDGVEESVTVTTDENGEFWLDDLYPGDYMIREKLEEVHEDVVPTTYQPDGKATFFVGSGEELAWRPGAAMPTRLEHEVVELGLAFGNAYVGSIHGCVFEDEDGNGMHDPGEMVLGGVQVQLSDGDGIVVATEITWVDGLFWFEGLYPDDYSITVVDLPDGAFVSSPDPIEVFVGSLEELVHSDGAAHLEPDDPQHEVDLGSDLFILVTLPAPAAAPHGADIADDGAVAIPNPEKKTRHLVSLSARARLLDSSLLSYVNERETRAGDQIEDLTDEEDDLFSLLAVDRWL